MTAYAYARVGYHRSLDLLRRNGWKGNGPVPWEHEPNRGFLRALAALARAADRIGEAPEAQRCADFLRDSSPAAYDALLGGPPRLDEPKRRNRPLLRFRRFEVRAGRGSRFPRAEPRSATAENVSASRAGIVTCCHWH